MKDVWLGLLLLIPAKYYPFMISLDKCSESCNSADDLHT